VLDTQDVPDVNPDNAQQTKSASQGQPQHEQAQANPNDEGQKGDKGEQGNDSNQDNSPQSDNNKNGKQQDSKQNAKDGSGKESSLMDKLRDAMANMMNKLKAPQKDGQQQSSQAQQNGKQDSSNQKGSQQKSSQSAAADKDAQQDQQQGDNGDKKQSADAKGGEKSADKSAPQDSKSGIGSEDGDKSAREAEQLKAMGKLSEILGKRSANVSGEVMVEVGSSKQQLKTPWSQKQAQHTDAGGEIHRDEVPLMYQQFVQQYFDEIRKSPDGGAGKTSPSAKPAASKDGKGAKAKGAPAAP
jgi:hypothetical protein